MDLSMHGFRNFVSRKISEKFRLNVFLCTFKEFSMDLSMKDVQKGSA